ncbi:MAG: hypothetical protein ACK5H1_09995 [Tenacibaculum sp.]
MKFKRKFGRKKKVNAKRGFFYILLLIVALLLWYNIEKIIQYIL